MPRPRKPIEMQKGNLTVVNGQKRRMEEESVMTDKNQLKRPPIWLIDDVAKKEWRRVVKELEKINPVSYTHLDVYKRQMYSLQKLVKMNGLSRVYF